MTACTDALGRPADQSGGTRGKVHPFHTQALEFHVTSLLY